MGTQSSWSSAGTGRSDATTKFYIARRTSPTHPDQEASDGRFSTFRSSSLRFSMCHRSTASRTSILISRSISRRRRIPVSGQNDFNQV